MKRSWGKVGVGLFCLAKGDRTKGSDLKMHHGRFKLSIKISFIPERVLKYWIRVPREVVDSTSLEVFKRCRDGVLRTWFSTRLYNRVRSLLDSMTLKLSSSQDYSVILLVALNTVAWTSACVHWELVYCPRIRDDEMLTGLRASPYLGSCIRCCAQKLCQKGLYLLTCSCWSLPGEHSSCWVALSPPTHWDLCLDLWFISDSAKWVVDLAVRISLVWDFQKPLIRGKAQKLATGSIK